MSKCGGAGKARNPSGGARARGVQAAPVLGRKKRVVREEGLLPLLKNWKKESGGGARVAFDQGGAQPGFSQSLRLGAGKVRSDLERVKGYMEMVERELEHHYSEEGKGEEGEGGDEVKGALGRGGVGGGRVSAGRAEAKLAGVAVDAVMRCEEVFAELQKMESRLAEVERLVDQHERRLLSRALLEARLRPNFGAREDMVTGSGQLGLENRAAKKGKRKCYWDIAHGAQKRALNRIAFSVADAEEGARTSSEGSSKKSKVGKGTSFAG